MKYDVGDRVRIIKEWLPDHQCGEARDGSMDHWLGQVMTIRERDYSVYRMVEDVSEYGGTGWFWRENCIAGFADPEPVDESDVELLNLIDESDVELLNLIS